MPFVIGTAGHIDHGKTALVKALTGQDTDRLKEEKERGISIDLGFAYLELPGGARAGVVDVPGHERFIRNMLAGAHGLDLVLLVVAADDGVMPQTEEHLDIVHLLGVVRGIVVITKIDLVAATRLREVEEDVAVLTAGSALEHAPVVRVSSVTGEGLDQLRAGIAAALTASRERPADGWFRLPVDRAFLLKGHGLVVTGTALGGEVRIGDHVTCVPGEHVFRVRGLQVHGEAVDLARRGQRVALNLSGDETAAIERGHVICHAAIAAPTVRLDARLDLRPGARRGVKSHQRVRVHVGTAERLGTVVVLGADRIAAKESAFCQLALHEPVLAMRGDRFIVRDETARRTLGGGVIVHPWARRHTRSEAGLQERLARLLTGNLSDGLEVVLRERPELATPLPPLVQFANRTEREVRDHLAGIFGLLSFDLESGDTVFTTQAKWQRVQETLTAALRAHHAAHPLAPGLEMEAVRETLPGSPSPRVLRAVVDRLAHGAVLVREGSLLRLPTHRVQLRADEQALTSTVLDLLGRAPLAPPDVKQLEADTSAGRTKLAAVLRVLEREKTIARASPEIYFLRDAVEGVKATLRQRLPAKSDVTPGTVRDLFGISRKYAIPLLELLDREGVTIRLGDARRMR